MQDNAMSGAGWDEGNAGLTHSGPITVRAPRKRTCLNGKLVYGEGSFNADNFFTLDCSVRNLSEGGAKITLSQQRPLPNSLYLIIVKYCVAYHAELAWMKYPSRGLRFRKTYPLEEPLPHEARFLHYLWADLYPRYSSIQHETDRRDAHIHPSRQLRNKR
jgi:hypothetical protein